MPWRRKKTTQCPGEEKKQHNALGKKKTMPWIITKQHNALDNNKTTQCTGKEQNNTIHWRRTKQHNVLEQEKQQIAQLKHKPPSTNKHT